jgi:hypothetical protein
VGKRVIGFGGSVTAAAESAGVFDALIPIADGPMTTEDAMRDAASLLERATLRAMKLIRIGARP